MSPERWKQVTGVFHAAVAKSPSERGPLLDAACAGDAELRAEVDAMLVAHRDAGAFGDDPPLPPPEAPRLAAGDALGPYRIEALIETGGMGEVYRAQDTRLDRRVAIKVLRLHAAGDPGLKQRLDREAKALATLSHPHICPVFDVGRDGGIDYLVMEFLDGETLAKRLERGALPLDQALGRAIEMADALDKAHRKGIVHRDLKPGNVMLTKRGAQLLDFGLAKLRAPPPLLGGATGTASQLTGGGTIIGTLQYMAPEQLNGQEADERTDIFAFGAVLHEMISGRKAFDGKTPASLIAAILEREPAPVSELQPLSPAALDHLVRTCLAKDPEQRWQSAADVARQLAWLLEGGPQRAASMPARSRRLPWLAAALLGAGAAAPGFLWLRSSNHPERVLQGSLAPPPEAVITPNEGFALSPDGSRLVFRAQDADGATRLWTRTLSALEARPLAGTEGAWQPFWSPDGRHIGFFADQTLKRLPSAGGAVQVVAKVSNPRGGAWSRDDRIVFAERRTGVFEVPAGGGTATPLTTIDFAEGELDHRWPTFLPDGRTVMFLVQTGEPGTPDDRSRVEALGPRGNRREILRVNSSAVYAPPGRLLYWREGAVHAIEFDAERLQTRGDARVLARDIALTNTEWAAFSVSDEGTMVYQRAARLPSRLEWRDRSGRILSEAAPLGEYKWASLSPDGSRLAYVTDNTTVWIRDLARGAATRVSFAPIDHYTPFWSPAGDHLAYAMDKKKVGTEVRARHVSGHGEERLLYDSVSARGYVDGASWSPDGRSIALEENGAILAVDTASGKARPLVDGPGAQSEPVFSPDGRWLAYQSNESGRDEVYVASAGSRGKWQVSAHGGIAPRWGAGGRELFFLARSGELTAVKAEPVGGEPRFGLAEALFPVPGGTPGAAFDVARDGRILLRTRLRDDHAAGFTLVANWPRLLEGPSR